MFQQASTLQTRVPRTGLPHHGNPEVILRGRVPVGLVLALRISCELGVWFGVSEKRLKAKARTKHLQ